MLKTYVLKGSLTVICIGIFLNASAQGNFTSMYADNLNASLMPPSPTAASFQKYGITPVSFSTGVANIAIPLYEIKAGGLSIPVTLSYHYNGLKPKDEAGWAGLGWNLNAGGVITRMQRGYPDGSRNPGKNFDDINPYDSAMSTANNRHKYFFGATYFDQAYDTEPDIFIYNFMGHSGKFVLIKGVPYFMNYERMAVTKFTDESGFLITDENGISFEFKAVERTRPFKGSDVYMQNPDGYITAWQLTKVISPDTRSWITCYYTDYSYIESGGTASQKHKICFYENVANYSCPMLGQEYFNTTTSIQQGSRVTGKSLSYIETSDGQKIKFIQSNSARLDINSTERALKQVVICGITTTDTVIKRFSFDYDYFKKTQALTGYYRLKLKQVFEQNAVGDTLNRYAFEYENEFDAFPQKNSFAIDHWGYSDNLDDAITMQSPLLPLVHFYPVNSALGIRQTRNYPGNPRTPDFNFVKYGALKRITYPTGGHTDFTYELNRYGMLNNTPVLTWEDTSFNDNTFNNYNAPAKYSRYGNFTLNENKKVYLSYSRDLWDSLSLPQHTKNAILIIRKYISGDCDNIPPNCIFDTVYRSTELYTGNSKIDSLNLTAGKYHYTLTCDSNFFSTGMAIWYKILVPQNVAEGEYGPGIRIATIKDYDGIHTEPASSKKYIYKDAANKCSGYLQEAPRYNVFITREASFAQGQGGPCTNTPMLVYNLSTDNNGIYNDNLNFNHYYTAVQEIATDDKNTNQVTEHYFSPILLTLPPAFVPVYYDGLGAQSCVYEDILTSEPVEVKTVVNKTVGGINTKIQEQTTGYSMAIDKAIVGIKPLLVQDPSSNTNDDMATTGWAFNKYQLFCVWKYPIYKQDITYDANGSSSVHKLEYVYDLKSRNLLRTKENLSNGDTLITKFKYPESYTATVTNLKTNHILTPVLETQVWQKRPTGDTSFLKGIITDYDALLFKPVKKYFLFNQSPLTTLSNETKILVDDVNQYFYSTLLSDNHYKEKMRYSYDSRGNIMEETADNNFNITTSYLWGYRGLYPVAKVIGAPFSAILQKIDTAALQNITDDAIIRSTLASLRSITGAHVSIFTFRPFVGVTSETDLNGKTTYYDYDAFNRLKAIRDFNNNILKTFTYSYASQPPVPPPPPPMNVPLGYTNTVSTGFTATYTSTQTNQQYIFPINAGQGTIGALPEGSYNLVIAKPGNTTVYIFGSGCGTMSQSGVSATFYNINVSTAFCNAVSINAQQ